MGKFGRKVASITSIVIIIIGWVAITVANSIPLILAARFLQGISMGMIASLGAILVGEYTSPKNRGAFLSILSLVMAVGTTTVHTVGSYLSWKKTAMLCTAITIADLVIAVFSPESPSWLADQGRYEECRKVFHWLRGYDEDDELDKMIEAARITREGKVDVPKPFWKDVKSKLAQTTVIMRKKEFYKPILLMIHIYTLAEWAGINILSPYIIDVANSLVDKEAMNIPALVISVDVQRILMGILTVYLIKKIRRRTILLSTTILCIIVLICTAGYSYAKTSEVLPFDHPSIPALLLHIHMLTIAVGSIPVPMVISGEIFPLEYRSLAGAISALFLSLHFFIVVKTFPYFVRHIGLHGAYLIYTCVVTYCLIISWLYLPETKDRTLQEIEEEFRGRPVRTDDLKASESLMG
ncbi:facilitated trehalose transporter Tret1 isoform X2 [Manduca sexta]|nr:facilitated trehalose transporter Tret1 isoform X2 [Manduca sexta]